MLLSEKIMQLRKKNGWSQEELAQQLDVSRQSVSKWEAGGSIPDLNKILKMSEIFNVSTDYLLKDEIEDDLGKVQVPEVEEQYEEKKVTAEMANEYMSLCKSQGRKIAIGTVLCILSPTILILLAALSDSKLIGLSEDAAAGIGLLTLVGLVSMAVYIFIGSGHAMEKYDFIEKVRLDLEYGVQGIVKERRKAFSEQYHFNLTLGIILCILSVVPIFVCLVANASDVMYCIAIDVLLVIVAVGVQRIITVGMIWSGFDKLLMEGDYTKESRKSNLLVSAISSIYWLIVVAIYLGYSFSQESWNISWVIWIVAGVIYPAIVKVVKLIAERK